MSSAASLNSASRLSLLCRLCVLLTVYTSAALAADSAIVVDGVFDEQAWQGAVHCTQWRRTQPFALDGPRYGNDLRIVATEAGLAAAFTIEQPSAERRMKPRTPRDSETLVGDTVGLIVDFDATGQVGYEFSVALGGGVRDGTVTNQREFNRDWDGVWQHAVRETDDAWFVEILIPWSSISMRTVDTDTRRIGIYATRYLFDRRERYACPGINDEDAVFLSDFQQVDVARQRPIAAFDFIPYGTVISDQLNNDTIYKAGADINWKPSQRFALSAAINPDFGQVESDELVVDFSAIETAYTDKRPFFTENQGLFDLRTPANGQLIYTRRIGGASDDGLEGSSDIDAAVKATGTLGALTYGAFVAQENDFSRDVGRRFAATRLAVPFDQARIGHLATWTESPYFDRTALVNAFDYEVTPNDWWRLSGQTVRSDIDIAHDTTSDYESWLQADFNRASSVTHTMKLLYIGDEFELDDLGYMERNSLRQGEWETNRRVAGSESARVTGENQRLYLMYRENGDGDLLQPRVQVSRDVQYRSSWRAYEELRYMHGAYDDQISRDHGLVWLDSRIGAYVDSTSPRLGDWTYVVGGYLFQQGVEDYSAWLQFTALWYPVQSLTLQVGLIPQWSDDWLLWEGQDDNLFGTYRSRRLDLDFRLDWIPSPRHELRLKLQWIGLEATPRQAYRTDSQGTLIPATDTIAPFTVNNVGLQIRYRYEIAPLSELFIVYARGGYQEVQGDEKDVVNLFQHISDVRDSDQILLKFRFRL